MVPKKLDTFILRDKYNSSEQEIFEAAEESSLRRAEIMGWTDISVVRTSDPSFKDEEFTCYTFDLIGIQNSSQSDNQEIKNTASSTKRSQVAARDLNP